MTQTPHNLRCLAQIGICDGDLVGFHIRHLELRRLSLSAPIKPPIFPVHLW